MLAWETHRAGLGATWCHLHGKSGCNGIVGLNKMVRMQPPWLGCNLRGEVGEQKCAVAMASLDFGVCCSAVHICDMPVKQEGPAVVGNVALGQYALYPC